LASIRCTEKEYEYKLFAEIEKQNREFSIR
jgi:hypothetical protein